MNFFKVTMMSVMAVFTIGSLRATQATHNFRHALLTHGGDHCLVTQNLTKLSPDDKCFGSFGPVMDTKFIGKVLRKDDTLVKSADFHKKCKNHMSGLSEIAKEDVDGYCEDMYEHFKAAHTLYMNSPRMNYLTK